MIICTYYWTLSILKTLQKIRETINGHIYFSVSTIILYYNVCLLVIMLSQQWKFPWYFTNTELGRKHIYYLNSMINNSKFELKYNLWFHTFEYSQCIIVLLFLPETTQKRYMFCFSKIIIIWVAFLIKEYKIFPVYI